MFNQSASGYSLSDIAAATGSTRHEGNDGWSDGGAWWIIILFLFCFAGWGGNGWNNGNGASGSTTREEVAYGFDINGLENGIRGIQSGLCDGFYALNSGLMNGFAGVDNQICNATNTLQNSIAAMNLANVQSDNAIQQAINADTVANMQNTYAVTGQLNNMSAQSQANFCSLEREIAKEGCDTRQAIANNSRDIIDNQNAGVRSILDFLTQDKITSLTAENQSLRFAASQQAQNTYLVNALNPAPVPAYSVPSPYSVSFYGSHGCCGCNSYA